MNTVFTKFKLSTGDVVEIIEVKGFHVFEAMILGGDNPAKIQRELMLICISKDGKKITNEYLDNLDAYDYLELGKLIGMQLEREKI